MDSVWYSVLVYLTILSPIFPILLLFLTKGKYSIQAKISLLIILFSSLISDVTCLFLSFREINNNFVIHFYTLIAGLSFLFYYKSVINKIWMKYFFWISSISFILVNFLESFWYSDIYTANTIAFSSLSVLLIVLALLFFFYRMNVIQSRDEIFDYLFWVNSAVLIYFGSTIILTLFEDMIINIPQEIYNSIWIIQLIASLAFVFMISKGIWTARKI